jgi:hypothetical protein
MQSSYTEFIITVTFMLMLCSAFSVLYKKWWGGGGTLGMALSKCVMITLDVFLLQSRYI